MPNYWGQKPDFRIPPLAIVIVVIGIIVFILFPNLFTNTYSPSNSTSTLSSSNNTGLPNSNNSNTVNSSDYPNQISPYFDNTLTNSRNNELSTGYWILFVYNSTLQQLPISAQDYAFLQNLVNSDSKGNPSSPIFLVENGQIQKYVISNEINSVISDLATIYKRSSTTGKTPTTPAPDTTSPSTTSPSTTSPSTTSPSTTSPSTTSPSTTSPTTSNSQNSTSNVIPK